MHYVEALHPHMFKGKTINKKGKKVFSGNRNLKASQWLCCQNMVEHGCSVGCHEPLQLRAYPPGYGQALLEIHNDLCTSPEPILRQKKKIKRGATDLEVFRSCKVYDFDSLWQDADLVGTYHYLKANKKVSIPAEWLQAFEEFEEEVAAVPLC